MKANEYYMCKIMGGGGGDTPTGEISITANGTYNVSSYASADVAVPEPSGTTTLTYDANGTYTEDVSDYASAEITVNVSGGGGGSVAPNDVNFYDYDGTIVYSYSASDFANLTSMPANPDHTSDGLTSQGWNWSLADAKAYVAKYGMLDVGQMYITTSGATEIDIDLQSGRVSPYLGISPNGTIEIDWGDGSPKDTVVGTSLATNKNTRHIYAQPGKYTIKLQAVNGTFAITGASSYSRLLTDDNSELSATRSYNLCIEHIRLGNNVSLSSYAFAYCSCIETVSMPKNFGTLGNDIFYNTHSLRGFVVPSGITAIPEHFISTCTQVRAISLPNGITTLGKYAFRNSYGLRRICFPESMVTFGSKALNECWTLGKIIIPPNVTDMSDAFNYNSSATELHVYPAVPPSVSSLYGIAPDCVFYVPTASLEAYQTATYWSNYASRMQGE